MVDTEVKRFSDYGRGSFYPDLPKVPLSQLINKEMRVLEATIVEDFDTDFGKSTFALLRCTMTDINNAIGLMTTTGAKLEYDEFTTICSGMVVVKKVRKVIGEKAFPIIGTITYNERYYDIN